MKTKTTKKNFINKNITRQKSTLYHNNRLRTTIAEAATKPIANLKQPASLSVKQPGTVSAQHTVLLLDTVNLNEHFQSVTALHSRSKANETVVLFQIENFISKRKRKRKTKQNNDKLQKNKTKFFN